MRLPALIVSVLLLVSTSLPAQEQEQKLVDRLLRPKLDLQNPSQGKTFNMSKSAPIKSVHTKTFQAGETRPATRIFSARRQVSTQEYAAFLFRDGSAEARQSKRSYHSRQLAIGSRAVAVRTAHEVAKPVQTQQFAGNRSFTGRGKSQKALSQKDTPLTIEQVRELLNRSK